VAGGLTWQYESKAWSSLQSPFFLLDLHGEFVLFVFFDVGHDYDDNGSGSGSGCWRVGVAVAAPGGG
jgi:hypothetical protein